MEISETITVQKSTAEVWSVVSNPDKRDTWIKGFSHTVPVGRKIGILGSVLRTTVNVDGKEREVKEETLATVPCTFLKKQITYKKNNAFTEISLQENGGYTVLSLIINVEFSGAFMKLRWQRRVKRIAAESLQQLREVLEMQSHMAAKRLDTLLNKMK